MYYKTFLEDVPVNTSNIYEYSRTFLVSCNTLFELNDTKVNAQEFLSYILIKWITTPCVHLYVHEIKSLCSGGITEIFLRLSLFNNPMKMIEDEGESIRQNGRVVIWRIK